MISAIVYGRNDNHGYNMHKRIAISLNCIAEVLTDPEDEILYVDYNTSNDLPTIVEALADTLTDKAKKLTRIFRVRPEVHDRFTDKTHAQVNEPLARNIAVRRSNPKNKWILSTNTDMVFTILDSGKSLSDVVKETEDGFYELARFDVPEPLWESLDRKNPTEIISKFREWGKAFHLNEVVYGNDTIIYDAPGDFQLMLREDIFKIGGFDERMIWGWHVDSNLCKRMKLLRGEMIKSLQDKLYGYHCNHTRLSGWMHSLKRKKENDIYDFFEGITTPYLPDQKDSWGLANESIEEIKIGDDATSNFSSTLQKVITTPLLKDFTEGFYNTEGYGETYYSVDHAVPYLLEQITLLRKKSNVVYVGYNQKMLERLESFCLNSGYKLHYYQFLPPEEKRFEVFLEYKLQPSSAVVLDRDEINDKSDILIFDFGVEEPVEIKRCKLEAISNLLNAQELVLLEIASAVSKKKFKVISVNVHNTRYYKSVKKFFSPIQNPYATKIMVGYKINSEQTLKNYFYSEYILGKISGLLKREKSLIFLIKAPLQVFCFALFSNVLYVVKLRSLRRRMIKNRKKLSRIFAL